MMKTKRGVFLFVGMMLLIGFFWAVLPNQPIFWPRIPKK